MRYSRMAATPPKRKKRFTNFLLVIIILGIAAYLIGAGAAGSWLAENVIDPVFNNGKSNAATPTAQASSAVPTLSETISPVSLPESSGTRAEEEVTAKEISLFSLQTGAFSDESNAKTAANELQSKGGAGYVAYDGKLYRVLVAGYTSADDADDVKTSLKGQNIDATVFNLKSGSLSFKIGAVQAQIDAVKACFDAVPEAVGALQQIVFDSDKGSKVDTDLASLKEKVTEVYNNFSGAVSSEESAISSLRTYMQGFCETINNIPLSSSVSSVEFSSKLKYTLIDITVEYSEFLEGLRK
jgi:hypothetical protein